MTIFRPKIAILGLFDIWDTGKYEHIFKKNGSRTTISCRSDENSLEGHGAPIAIVRPSWHLRDSKIINNLYIYKQSGYWAETSHGNPFLAQVDPSSPRNTTDFTFDVLIFRQSVSSSLSYFLPPLIFPAHRILFFLSQTFSLLLSF